MVRVVWVHSGVRWLGALVMLVTPTRHPHHPVTSTAKSTSPLMAHSRTALTIELSHLLIEQILPTHMLPAGSSVTLAPRGSSPSAHVRDPIEPAASPPAAASPSDYASRDPTHLPRLASLLQEEHPSCTLS